jgi:hypothetical protein
MKPLLDLEALAQQEEGQFFDRKSLWEGTPGAKRARDRRIGAKRYPTRQPQTPSPRSAEEKVGMRSPARQGPSPQPSPRFAGRGGRVLDHLLGLRLRGGRVLDHLLGLRLRGGSVLDHLLSLRGGSVLDLSLPSRQIPTRARRTVRDEIAAHVAAFANADGGVLILGIEGDGTVTGHGYPEEAILAVGAAGALAICQSETETPGNGHGNGPNGPGNGPNGLGR